MLPTKAPRPPNGEAWLQIKHDGFRVVARKDGDRVRLYSRPDNDLTYRFSLIVEALARLRSRSCILSTARPCPVVTKPIEDHLNQGSTSKEKANRSGAATRRPGEFHPEPLTEPDLTLSRHPARATARRLPPSIEYRVPPVAG
jgi:hypothetical protein